MRGCCLQLVMNIPFTALYFASYETAKRATMKHANCEESLLIQGVAGTITSAPSYKQSCLLYTVQASRCWFQSFSSRRCQREGGEAYCTLYRQALAGFSPSAAGAVNGRRRGGIQTALSPRFACCRPSTCAMWLQTVIWHMSMASPYRTCFHRPQHKQQAAFPGDQASDWGHSQPRTTRS